MNTCIHPKLMRSLIALAMLSGCTPMPNLNRVQLQSMAAAAKDNRARITAVKHAKIECSASENRANCFGLVMQRDWVPNAAYPGLASNTVSRVSQIKQSARTHEEAAALAASEWKHYTDYRDRMAARDSGSSNWKEENDHWLRAMTAYSTTSETLTKPVNAASGQFRGYQHPYFNQD